jgi:hypothetical protein
MLQLEDHHDLGPWALVAGAVRDEGRDPLESPGRRDDLLLRIGGSPVCGFRRSRLAFRDDVARFRRLACTNIVRLAGKWSSIAAQSRP